MRVYSDILNKPFDSEEECLAAEAVYKKEQKKVQDEIKKAVEEKKAREEALNASKKELAKAIESAQKDVDEANNIYEAAKEKATDIINEASKKANELLDTAKSKVREAQQKKYEAVSAFNKKFGPYTVTLTGDQAAEEYSNALKSINNVWKEFFKDFWRMF